MHVLYFHQHFTTPSGANGTRSYEFARALVARGHKVTMVCGSTSHGSTRLNGAPRNGIRTGDRDGIHIIEFCLPYSNHDGLLKRSLTFLRFAIRSVLIAWRTDYDVLFATSTPLTAALPGIVLRLVRPGKPFLFEVRDLWPELPRAMKVITNPLVLFALSCLEWLAYNTADACIGLSPGIVEGIKRRCWREKPVVMIPNASDLDVFQPSAARETRGEQGKFQALFAGSHGIANGLDAVLDAARVLIERNRSDIELLFVGDGKLKPQLIARAQREGLRNCRFCDPVPKTTLSRIMTEVDVGLMILSEVPAFYYGTSPNKFFDYISAGLPVLNNYPGWLADLINTHHCGMVVPPANPIAFADALEKLADDEENRKRMGSNARRLAEQRFDRRQFAAIFVELLERYGTRQTVAIAPESGEGRDSARKAA